MNKLGTKATLALAAAMAVGSAHAESKINGSSTVIVDLLNSRVTSIAGASVGRVGPGFAVSLSSGDVVVGLRMRNSEVKGNVTVRVKMRESRVTNAGGGDTVIGMDLH